MIENGKVAEWARPYPLH